MLLNAYENLQINKGALTQGPKNTNTVDGFDENLIKELNCNLIKGTYKWKNIKLIEILKPGKNKKRPLGIPSFSDKLVQESIRIVLNLIYEPIFESINSNYGFRPKKGVHTAMKRLINKSQGLDYALEGDIKGAYPSVNHKILMKILKEKIIDKKLLKLIETGLKHNIEFKKDLIENKIGTPQGSIVSPILFNIYMHKFDEYIINQIKKLDLINEKEGRKKNYITKITNREEHKITKIKKKIEKLKTEKKFFKQDYIRKITEIRKIKKNIIHRPSKIPHLHWLRIHYCRYADDWILITNIHKRKVIDLKNEITIWLKNNLKLELDQEKTYITDLRKKGQIAKFLGFTIYHTINKKTIKVKRNNKIFKRKTNEVLHIGIDLERLKNRFIDLKMITEKLKTRYVGLYCSLKAWHIIEKFTSKLQGLINYYYPILTFTSDLSFIYYVLKYSCLKTIAHRMKISISKIYKKFGPNITMKKDIIKLEKKTNRKINKPKMIEFPSYLQIMDKTGTRIAEDQKSLPIVYWKDLTKPNYGFVNPFNQLDINVNVRTGSKIYKHCCVCGVKNGKNNPIQMHHIRHLKDSKITGFAKIMKSLNRKRIPCCKRCHYNIHKGNYNGMKLTDLYDINIITD